MSYKTLKERFGANEILKKSKAGETWVLNEDEVIELSAYVKILEDTVLNDRAERSKKAAYYSYLASQHTTKHAHWTAKNAKLRRKLDELRQNKFAELKDLYNAVDTYIRAYIAGKSENDINTLVDAIQPFHKHYADNKKNDESES
jgi:hypothetical protein